MNRWMPLRALCTAVTITSLGSGQACASSILERVIAQLVALDSTPLVALFGNIADNSPASAVVDVKLSAGVPVIYGYDRIGQPLSANASPTGLEVTPLMAANVGSGLAAGLYPIGSALYSIPPAGQLSLFNQASDGTALALAREALMTRIDGSITTVIAGMQFPDLAPAALAQVYDPALGAQVALATLVAGNAATTALGAVNTGQIVTNVQVTLGQIDPSAQFDMRLADATFGANAAVDAASASATAASSLRITQLGGQADSAVLMINLASNAVTVTGRVETIVSETNARIGNTMTTALGAVNGGSVQGGE